jgi:hypothetical protein
MVRKYDRYGYNRQFKAKPCTRRYPFPYPLPFVDDFSAGAVLEKHISAPPEFTKGDIDTAYGGNKRSRANARHYIEESQRKRRATNAARKLTYPDPLGGSALNLNQKYTKEFVMAVAAPLAPLAAPLLFESAAVTRGAISTAARIRTRRQALRDSRAILKAMESKPKLPRKVPGQGLIKAFKKMNRKIRKANTIMNWIDRLPIRY